MAAFYGLKLLTFYVMHDVLQKRVKLFPAAAAFVGLEQYSFLNEPSHAVS